MKIALFYDSFGAVGGGERTVLALAEVLGADIFTTDTDALSFLHPNVRITSLGSTVKIPPLKQISTTLTFSRSDISDAYDFFLFTGNWTYYAAKIYQPNLWYCFTPTRAFYDLYQPFLDRQDLLTRQAFRVWAHTHRWFDQRSVKDINQIVAISETVRKRILQYYGRDSLIIYPPVDTSRFSCREYGDFWLSVNRFYPEKRIELQIKAFRSMPDEQLVICGGYAKGDFAERYVNRIIKDLPENVTIKGEVNDDELINLYSRCRGLICTARSEDFGLTPVEAMASGKPVVAVAEGGFTETVIPGTGVLISADIGSIRDAVGRISPIAETYKNMCIKQAKKYDSSIFANEFRKCMQNIINNP